MYMNVPAGQNFVSPHSAPSEIAEEAARRREVRLSKNREAARECRRKKKEYVKCLENRVQVLEGELLLSRMFSSRMYFRTKPITD